MLSKDIDDCVNRTCHNGGSCIDGINSYSCNCVAGFTGNHCETGKTLIITILRNLFERASQKISYTQFHANLNFSNVRYFLSTYSFFTDIDECANRTCHNGGSCIDGINSYSCNCVAGFTGDHCETGEKTAMQ